MVLPGTALAASAAIVWSAGFTDEAVLQAAPAAAAVYGLVFPASNVAVPTVFVSLDDSTGAQPIVVTAVVDPVISAGTGTSCDAQCYAAGYICAIGLNSCCSAPSCPMGCAIGGATSSLATCVATCRDAKGKCSYTVNGTGIDLEMCGDCLDTCPGCPDFEAQCEIGCGFAQAAVRPRAWKAVLPAQPTGGSWTLTANCSTGCAAGTALVSAIRGVTFGLVIYASGQSNMALGVEHSFTYAAATAAIESGHYSNIRFYQYGGMGSQSDTAAPAWATTALTFPAWPWQNLSASIGRKGYPSFKTLSATAFHFAQSVTDALGDAAPPIGIITNAVGGTTIEAWSSAAMLAECKNTTTANSAAPPLALFNGMASPFINTTIGAVIWYQVSAI